MQPTPSGTTGATAGSGNTKDPGDPKQKSPTPLTIVCDLCPHGCNLSPGQTGACKARIGTDAGTKSLNYGKLTSIALDPIEKKPLSFFHPGSKILSVGSFGCNLSCPFCQNHRISMAGEADIETTQASPEKLAKEAERLIPAGNIGIAFTYNEPLIGYEFVMDTAEQIRAKNLKNILVTNGYINRSYLEKLLPLIDAMNIDLKSYNPDFYRRIGGDLEIIKENIKLAASLCHVELTCLIIEGENDSEDEMLAMSQFIASISPDIPLHISRFFPQYKYTDKRATPIETLYCLEKTAKTKINNVILGNV